MATLRNNIEGIRSEVTSTVRSFANSFQDTFNSIVGGVEARIGGIYGGDVVGINVDQIPAMQQAIRDYVTTLDQHLAQVNANAETANAYRGEYATAIRGYVEAVTNACGALTSQLLKFNETLEEVRSKYLAHAGEGGDLSSQLSSQAGELNSSFTRYTE